MDIATAPIVFGLFVFLPAVLVGWPIRLGSVEGWAGGQGFADAARHPSRPRLALTTPQTGIRRRALRLKGSEPCALRASETRATFRVAVEKGGGPPLPPMRGLPPFERATHATSDAAPAALHLASAHSPKEDAEILLD
jgi:hypothetical protein